MVSTCGLTLPIRYSSKERAVLELLDEHGNALREATPSRPVQPIIFVFYYK